MGTRIQIQAVEQLDLASIQWFTTIAERQLMSYPQLLDAVLAKMVPCVHDSSESELAVLDSIAMWLIEHQLACCEVFSQDGVEGAGCADLAVLQFVHKWSDVPFSATTVFCAAFGPNPDEIGEKFGKMANLEFLYELGEDIFTDDSAVSIAAVNGMLSVIVFLVETVGLGPTTGAVRGAIDTTTWQSCAICTTTF